MGGVEDKGKRGTRDLAWWFYKLAPTIIHLDRMRQDNKQDYILGNFNLKK